MIIYFRECTHETLNAVITKISTSLCSVFVEYYKRISLASLALQLVFNTYNVSTYYVYVRLWYYLKKLLEGHVFDPSFITSYSKMFYPYTLGGNRYFPSPKKYCKKYHTLWKTKNFSLLTLIQRFMTSHALLATMLK